MNEIQLTLEDILDLIFERKVELGDTKISTVHSFQEILSEIEERHRYGYGKISRSKSSALRGNDGKTDRSTRVELIGRPVYDRRKKVYDLV